MPAAIRLLSSRLLIVAVGISVATVGLTLSREDPAAATPVNTTSASYNACDRVYPDPQAYWPSPAAAPDQSPFAKGVAACQANEFVTYQEMIDGNTFLESLFPDFVEFYELETDFGDGTDCASPAASNDDYCSAGLSRSGAPFPERQKEDLYLLRITDERVPEANKKLFAFPLGIHGIERAGVEGGTRAAEDLATWAWCEATAAGETLTPASGAAAGAAPNCAQEGAPHPILETQPDTSLTAGHVLKNSSVYFVYANADGWRRGDPDNVPRGYQRYNGNSVDMNRDWPTMGYTFRPYTPWSEPETKAFGQVLQGIRKQWDGGIDLHGQLNAVALSFTMLGASQRDFGKNQRILQTVKGAWEDAEQRLGWHNLIVPNDEERPTEAHMYGVQWGTIWDTINYTVTGAFGDWIDSPLGLGADGIDNEMSLSHISNCGTGTCFLKDIEQLHIDGNKSLIYAMLNFSLLPEDTSFNASGRVGYVHDPRRLSHKGSPTAPNPYAGLPQQEPINDAALTPANSFMFEFDVQGPESGVYNGGLEATATPVSLGGFNLSTTPATTALILEQFMPHGQEGEDPPTADDNGCGMESDRWIEQNRYFNQNQLYFSSGQAVHANVPDVGLWRVCIDGGLESQAISTGGYVDVDIRFLAEQGWEDPGQLPYDVSNMDFFTELAPYMRPGQLEKVNVDKVLKGKAKLGRYTSLVIADNAFPGYSEAPPTGSAQQGLSFANPGAATTPCAGDASSEAPCSEDFEFVVEPGANNQQMMVHIEPGATSVDYDLYVQRQDPETGNYVTVGQSATGSADETVTLISPPDGTYRARVVNWSGGGPLAELTIEFSNEYAGPPIYKNQRTQAQVNRWGDLLRRYVEGGGNLVLTDGAIKALAHMNVVERKFIRSFTQYAGYIGFTPDAGDTDTYADPLAANVDQPGAAEGEGHRHQTYEPVPIGFPIQDEGGADYNGSFVTTIDQPEWEKRGGRTAGTTTAQQVSLGEIKVGQGQVRVIGALIPMPSQESYHPFGLASYAVTYTGYQVLNNALQIPGVPPGGGLKGCGRLSKVTGFNKIFGTAGKDLLKGTAGADAICGGPGNDKIRGLGAKDILIGGKGNDRISGGSGNDRLYLGAGNDRANGGKGKDRIAGFKGNDRLRGGGGNDFLNGMAGKDRCNGGGGKDRFRRCEIERA